MFIDLTLYIELGDFLFLDLLFLWALLIFSNKYLFCFSISMYFV